MPLSYLIARFFFYVLGLVLVLALNFSYAYFCRHFKQKYFEALESNFNKVEKSLFSAFEFSFNYKDLKHEERWLSYFIVTVPILAVYIRCAYYDLHNISTGIYVFTWQVLLHVLALFFAWFRYQRFQKIKEELKKVTRISELDNPDHSKEDVQTILNTMLSEKEGPTELLKRLNEKYIHLSAFF
jgi:cell shape-determining protein MreC